MSVVIYGDHLYKNMLYTLQINVCDINYIVYLIVPGTKQRSPKFFHTIPDMRLPSFCIRDNYQSGSARYDSKGQCDPD